jgi:hypothetical protein
MPPASGIGSVVNIFSLFTGYILRLSFQQGAYFVDFFLQSYFAPVEPQLSGLGLDGIRVMLLQLGDYGPLRFQICKTSIRPKAVSMVRIPLYPTFYFNDLRRTMSPVSLTPPNWEYFH